MKIYFAGSIRAGRRDEAIYRELIVRLQAIGTVLTEHLWTTLSVTGDRLPVRQIYQRDCGWIDQSDIIIAEITQPSTGVGYEIGYAEGRGKPVFCLFRPSDERRVSAMVEGNPNCIVILYGTVDEAIELLKTELKKRKLWTPSPTGSGPTP